MHGSNRLGGNSLGDLLVFGRRAGIAAAEYVAGFRGEYPAVPDAAVAAAQANALAPFAPAADGEAENPYTLHQELQQTMNDLVGIIRKAEEMQEALDRLKGLKARAANVRVDGGRAFNPGWHVALDLRNMLAVSECVARAALMREESRGGHTRDDFPKMESRWRGVNLICSVDGADVSVVEQPMVPMRADLLALFTRDELAKYLTEEELAALPEDTK
jgi:succinate dehydrogenase / fumarate reductase flavoprotein subunit